MAKKKAKRRRRRRRRKGKKKGKKKNQILTPEQIAEMEKSLQENLTNVTGEINVIKAEIEELRAENIRLQDQAGTLRDDTNAYVSEMRARAERRQAILQGITMLKQKQLDSVNEQRAENLSNYQRLRVALQSDILNRGQELALAQKQLQDLEPIRRLQSEQSDKIAHLEEKLKLEKEAYERQILDMKRRLIELKYQLTEELQQELQEVEEKAGDVAKRCLNDYVARVKDENSQLRIQLKELITDNKKLEAEYDRQAHIRNEQQRERDYRADIIRRLEQKLLND